MSCPISSVDTAQWVYWDDIKEYPHEARKDLITIQHWLMLNGIDIEKELASVVELTDEQILTEAKSIEPQS